MQRLLVAFFAIAFSSCVSAQEDLNIARNCNEAPSLRELMTISTTSLDDLTVEEQVIDTKSNKTYFKDGKLFTGWAFTLYVQTVHKFRFYHIEEGKVKREVAYYGSGQIDFDFNFSNQMPEGCHRMWNEDGTVISDQFYKAGKLHGRQLHYTDQGVLERDETYKNGVLQEQ